MKSSFLKNPRLVSALAGAAFAVAALGAAPLAQAAALTSVQISAIASLLQAFGADPSTVANVEAVLSGTATSTASASGDRGPSAEGVLHAGDHASSCSAIAANLSFGSSGDDVSQLQSFLSKDRNVYPQGLVTGYFGSDTEDAVQRWQAEHDIVATGTPDTTGFGLVGPHTRGEINKEMEVECEGGDSGATASSTVSSEGESEGASASSTASTATSSDSGSGNR